jgi:hypothetical protein
MHKRSSLLAIVMPAAMVLVAGCHEQAEIRRYKAPHVEETVIHAKRRLLGAIGPHDQKIWFFKLEGPDGKIEKHRKEFDQFIRSIRFRDNGPISWQLPKGWREEPGKEMRYATIRPGDELELTVVPLGIEAASVLANVNRWRRQLGLPPIDELDLVQETEDIEVDGKTLTLIDISGPGAGSADNAMALKLDYKVPDGWKEIPAEPPRLAAFKVKEADKIAEVTVTSFPGKTGSLLDNINRWRGQVALPPIEGNQMERELQSIQVAGAKGHYTDQTGRKSRILAVMLERDRDTVFFKMTGDPELVGKQKSAFESFIMSINFAPGAGK